MVSTEARDERPLGTLLSDIARDGAALARAEVELARAELAENASRFAFGIALVAAGAILAFAAMLLLLAAATVGLGLALDLWSTHPWLPPLLVGIATAIVAAVLMVVGRGAATPSRLLPRRAAAAFGETVARIRTRLG